MGTRLIHCLLKRDDLKWIRRKMRGLGALSKGWHSVALLLFLTPVSSAVWGSGFYSVMGSAQGSNVVVAVASTLDLEEIPPQARTEHLARETFPFRARMEIKEILKGVITNSIVWVIPVTPEGSPPYHTGQELRVLRGRETIVFLRKREPYTADGDFSPTGCRGWEFSHLGRNLSPEERADRVRLLKQFIAAKELPSGPERIEAIRPLLRASDELLVYEAWYCLQNELLRDCHTPKQRMAKMDQLLRSEDRDFRAAAIRSLGWQDAKALPKLIRASRDPDPFVLEQVVNALVARQEQVAMQLRIELARHRNQTVRIAGMYSLRWNPSPEAKQVIVDTLDDPDPTMRAVACRSLERSIASDSGHELKPKLMQMSRDRDETVRVAAIHSLSHYREKMPLSLFIEILREPDVSPAMARAILASIRSQYVLNRSELQITLDQNIDLFTRHAGSRDPSFFYPAMRTLADSRVPNAQESLRCFAEQHPNLEAQELAKLLLEGKKKRGGIFLRDYR